MSAVVNLDYLAKFPDLTDDVKLLRAIVSWFPTATVEIGIHCSDPTKFMTAKQMQNLAGPVGWRGPSARGENGDMTPSKAVTYFAKVRCNANLRHAFEHVFAPKRFDVSFVQEQGEIRGYVVGGVIFKSQSAAAEAGADEPSVVRAPDHGHVVIRCEAVPSQVPECTHNFSAFCAALTYLLSHSK
jgi:hypothetical protein